MNTSLPQHVGPYTLEAHIGSGGMGKVYRSTHPTLGRTVAIKLILDGLTEDAKTRDRFQREATTIAQLRHENIVMVYDFGVDDNRAYMVLEYIGGGTLRDLLQAGNALPHADALRIAGQIADALQYAHQRGIVHRDLKPANIMFTDDSHQQAVLTDFGLVQVLGSTIATEHGSFVGTPAYVSPEVIGGDPATPASDMYALGLLLVEMLTGKSPAPTSNLGALMLWHIKGKRPDLSGLGLPAGVSDRIGKLLSIEPDQRPTAADVIHTLRANDDTKASEFDTLAGPTLLLLEQATPHVEARLIGTLPLNFDKKRPFLGRDNDVRALQTALANRQRVIAVIGKSGIGKSALVSKVLYDVLNTNESLSGIVAASATETESETLQLTLDTILANFHSLLPDADLAPNPQATPQQDADRLMRALHNGNYILLLDNLETLQADDHSVRDAGIAALLEAAIDGDGLSVVITSQVPLRLAGVGKTARISTITLDSGLDTQAALVLLRQLWAGDQIPDDGDLQRLAEAVDGHPRALEATSDWLVEHPLSTIDDLLDELAQQQGDVVYHLVGKSIDALTADMQRLLAALAIFDSSTTLPAVQAVIEPFVAGNVRELLNRLVLRRFVRFDPTARTLDLHTLDRSYSLTQLPQTTEDESVYGRYALLRRAAIYFKNIRKPEDEWKSYDDVKPQLYEISFRMRLNDNDTAAEILHEIGMKYLGLWGHDREVAALYEKLRGRLQSQRLLQRSLGHLGRIYMRFGRMEASRDLLQEAISMAASIGERSDEALWIGMVGNNYLHADNYTEAIKYYQQALAICRELGDRYGEGAWLGNLGIIYLLTGEPDTAIEHYQQALAICRELDDPHGAGINLGNLGLVHYDLGHIDKAIDYLQQGLAISIEVGDKRHEALWLDSLGSCYSKVGDIRTAIEYYRQALTISNDLGYKSLASGHLINLGWIHYILSDNTTAIDQTQQGLAIAREIDKKGYESSGMSTLGRCLAEQADYNTAIDYLNHAVVLAREVNDPVIEADSLCVLAETYLLQADFDAAAATLNEGIHFDIVSTKHRMTALLGVIYVRLGQAETARQAFSDAIEAASALLAKTENYWSARYALGIAQAGLALLDGTPIEAAIATYQRARQNCNADGVLRNQRRWLELLVEAEGGAVLMPVKEVLSR